MAGRYLLDTNILIAFMKAEHSVAERAASASFIAIPFMALAELHFGARNSRHVEENVRRVEHLARSFDTLWPDLETVRGYGSVKSGLKAAGRPIPEADLWIAALAIQHELILVSRDEHFRQVSRLSLEHW